MPSRRRILNFTAFATLVALVVLSSKRQGAPARPIGARGPETEREQRGTQTRQPLRAAQEGPQQGWHPEESRHHRQERRYWWTSAAFTSIAAGGAIWSVILSQSSLSESRKAVAEAHIQSDTSLKQLATMQRDQAGWFALQGMNISSYGDVGTGQQQVEFSIKYNNVGRLPLTRNAFLIRSKWVEAIPGKTISDAANMSNSFASPATECTEQGHDAITVDSYVVYPQTQGPSFYRFGAIFGFGAIEEMRGYAGTYMINGCAVYSTNAQEHHSWFCMFMDPDPKKVPTEWISLDCERGNGAD